MACKDVLIIDDDSGIRETLRDLLELEGFRVTTAINGLEGLQRLQQLVPCLILLDLMMPIMNGWEFLQRLKTDHNEILAAGRVAVLSAATYDSSELQAYGCSIHAKPMQIQRLLEVVHGHCKSGNPL